MMRIITIFFVLLCTQVTAQVADKMHRVKNGADIRKTLPTRDRYLYEKFQNGNVYFRNGTISQSPLNYSLFHGEIQFISASKDTLLLLDNDFISKVIIQKDTFYFNRGIGHVQGIGRFGKVRLGEQQRLLVMGHEKYAGYSEYSGTSAISSYSHFTNSNGEMQQLEANDKLMLRRKHIYFLIDQNLQFVFAGRTGFVKLFPRNKRDINDFIKKHETNFSTEKDIISLLEFCQSL